MNALETAVAVFGLLGATAAMAPARARALVAAALTALASMSALLVAAVVVHTHHQVQITSKSIIPFGGAALRLDALGALFAGLTALVAIAASVYLIGYARHHAMSRTASAAFPLFVTSMLLVPAAWNVMTFLLLWELMALTSLALVLSDYRRSEGVRSAGLWYAVLTHAAAASIALGLLLIAGHAHCQDFGVIAAAHATMTPGLRGAAFLLLFVGFASKSGIVPLHVWLPRAHAEAPSAVSALMSAAMVNLGVYGVLRVGDTLLGGGPQWWWITVTMAGTVSAIYGSIHAATSTDLKRLLAYSTTDNIGLVFIALGTAGLLHATGHPAYATLALFAGLFHLVNHSVFKGALFLSAGSIQYTTGTRNLDLLGGLLKRMPIASSIFAVGAVAISALPPLGGFVSEWILLQSLLHGLSTSTTVTVILVPLSVAALALTGGLTAAAFVKAFGVGFLGVARSESAAQVVEPPRLMNVGAGLLGAACIVLGLAPMVATSIVDGAVRSLEPGYVSAVRSRGVALALRGVHGVFEPTLIALALVTSLSLVGGLRWFISRRRSIRRAVAWGCGREQFSPRMTYTATSFAEPLQRVFDDVVQPSRDLDVSHQSESRYFVESVRFASRDADAFERYLYHPAFAMARTAARAARRLQNGSIHRYLGYGLVGLVIILVVSR